MEGGVIQDVFLHFSLSSVRHYSAASERYTERYSFVREMAAKESTESTTINPLHTGSCYDNLHT